MSKKINVAIFTRFLTSWTGGENYLRNLLIALDRIEERRVAIFLLTGTEENVHLQNCYSDHATVIRSRIFNKIKKKGYWAKKKEKIREILVWRKLLSLNVHVVSHSYYYGEGYPFKTLNWIPDFQHLHLPEMFDGEEVANRNSKFDAIIRHSDGLIFSSQDAKDDAITINPSLKDKYKVLRFVSIPEVVSESDIVRQREVVNAKYNIGNEYFYLPNQFWKHKNHITVFKAIKRLKDNGSDVKVVCTGDTEDYRNLEHMKELRAFIKENHLSDNIIILGKIAYKDVFILICSAIAVINPSLFEGWSSIVEEAKSLNRKLLLSNINVHREQAPEDAEYFDPENHHEVAEVLSRSWSGRNINTVSTIDHASNDKRILQFGKKYENIVVGLMNRSDTLC